MVCKTKPILKADRARFELLKQMPCIACVRAGKTILFCGETEIHHLLSGGRRIGHQATVPLGAWHHRGVLRGAAGRSAMIGLFGPSLADGSKPFHDKHGTDSELLAETNRRIQLEAA